MTIKYEINEQHPYYFIIEDTEGEIIGHVSLEEDGQYSYIVEDEDAEIEDLPVYFADTKQGAINRLLKLVAEMEDN